MSEHLLNSCGNLCSSFQDLDNPSIINEYDYDLPSISNLLNLITSNSSVQHNYTHQQHPSSIISHQLEDSVAVESYSFRASQDIHDENASTATNASLPSHPNEIQFSQSYIFDSLETVTNKTNQHIKSELIKSENSETVKERSNGSLATTIQKESRPMKSPIHNLSDLRDINQSEPIFEFTVPLHKCKCCSFLSLNESELYSHSKSTQCNTNRERIKLICPGCKNVFYSCVSLETHFREDHIMSFQDIQQLQHTIKSNTAFTNNLQYNNVLNAIDIPVYLLRNDKSITHQNQTENNDDLTLMQEDSDLSSVSDNVQQFESIKAIIPQNSTNKSNLFIEESNLTKEKQNISEKSIETFINLTPTSQQSEINSDNNFNSNIDTNPLCLKTFDIFTNSTTNEVNIITNHNVTKNQRQPKISIKNVDILNNLIISDIANINPEQCSSNIDKVLSLSEFENTSEINNLNPVLLSSNINVERDASKNLEYSFEQNANNFKIGKDIFDNSVISNRNQSSVKSLEAPMSAQSVFLPNLLQKNSYPTIGQKVFIKNVDILKKPTNQEQRATLTVHTVDELNLMNQNEVKHLIAPNLDTINTLHKLDKVNCFNILTSNSGLKMNTEINKIQNFETSIENSISDIYDFEEEILSESLLSFAHKTDFDIDLHHIPSICVQDIESLSNVDNGNPGIELLNKASKSNTNSDNMSYNENRSSLNLDINLDQITYNNSINLKSNQLSEIVTPILTTLEPIENATRSVNIHNSYLEDIPPLVPVTSVCNNTSNEALPPLVPVNVNSNSIRNNSLTIMKSTPNVPDVPLPPLIFSVNRFSNNSSHNTEVHSEKRRLLISNSLTTKTESQIKKTAPVSTATNLSIRGRPYGSYEIRSDLTLSKKSKNQLRYKCDIKSCIFRFKNAETLEYHKRCHNDDEESQAIQCPECKSKFTNWNNLHTHLWRTHEIDMELYNCDICNFKTPIYSRLVNIHSKIHSDARNFQCELCNKSFKNTKQLKNHRRRHRIQLQTVANISESKSNINLGKLHRCLNCNSVFSHPKSLREHVCINSGSKLQCETCGRIVTSKSSFRLHMLTHDVNKRFFCKICEYMSNDHNAFRRHKMLHENRKMYSCPLCDYKSIQSVAFQKHVQQKHPDKLDSIVYKCFRCTYATINSMLFSVHQAKCVKSFS